jgi:hypothetical protein
MWAQLTTAFVQATNASNRPYSRYLHIAGEGGKKMRPKPGHPETPSERLVRDIRRRRRRQRDPLRGRLQSAARPRLAEGFLAHDRPSTHNVRGGHRLCPLPVVTAARRASLAGLFFAENKRLPGGDPCRCWQAAREPRSVANTRIFHERLMSQVRGHDRFAGSNLPLRVPRPIRVLARLLIQTGVGPVEVRRARVRDRSEAGAAGKIRLSSPILPKWA